MGPRYSIQPKEPVPVAKAIIQNDAGQILLVKRSIEPSKGKWTIVGGRFLVQDDTAESRAIMEVKAQTGLDVELTRLVDVRTDPPDAPPTDPRFFVVKVIYLAQPIGGALKTGEKTSDLKWVTMDEARAMKKQIGFDHMTLLERFDAKRNFLIPIERSRYTEYYGKEYPYPISEYPRFACMAIILNNKKEILLAHRAKNPYLDHWNFPGGHMYIGETPSVCVRREVMEELGVESEVGELFHVYSDKGQHPKFADVAAYFFVTIKSQKFIKNVEMNDFGYYSFDKLPQMIAYKNRMVLEDIRKRLHV